MFRTRNIVIPLDAGWEVREIFGISGYDKDCMDLPWIRGYNQFSAKTHEPAVRRCDIHFFW
jgi:hypothetical protein